MARQYRVGAMTHAINGVFRAMTAMGVGASYRRILTVKGRRTGKSHSTPVDVMDRGGELWLVAPYGQVNWVKNAAGSWCGDAEAWTPSRAIRGSRGRAS